MPAAFFFILLALAAANTAFAQDGLQGDWIGVLEVEKKSSPLRLHIENSGGKITMPAGRLFEEPLTKFEVHGTAVSFELEKEKRTITFSGACKANFISGNYSDGTAGGNFQLQRFAQVVTPKYFGTYENASGW